MSEKAATEYRADSLREKLRENNTNPARKLVRWSIETEMLEYLFARIDTLTAENAALRGDLSTVRTMLGIERASNTNYVSINAMLVVIDSALDRASKETI